MSRKKVFVNGGHGGTDSGAVGNGLKEKDITKKISELIVKGLSKYDVDVMLFQQSQSGNGLKTITDKANNWKADILVSVHVNSGGGTGFESFAYSGSVLSNTLKLQRTIHDEVMKSIKDYGVVDRGRKRQNFHVLRESKMSSVLTENMFIDSVRDSKLLKDNKFIEKVADGHVKGIVRFLSLKKKKTEDSDNLGYWRVVTDSYKSKDNAVKRQKELEKKGIKSFLVYYKE